MKRIGSVKAKVNYRGKLPPMPMDGDEDRPELVRIVWVDYDKDWEWFWLLEFRDNWVKLRGADYPDGSGTHRGDEMWVHRSDIRHIEAWRGDAGDAPD